MKGSITARLGLAIGALLMAGTAMAQGPGMDPGSLGGPGQGMDGHRPPFERAFGGGGIGGRWWNNPRIVERLKLTDDQRKGFDQILLQHRETLVDLHANLEKAEIALEPLVRDDQPNESAILAQIDKVAQARAELEKANARYLLALRSKLTPEQWKQVQEFRENREQQGRGYGRGGFGQGGYGGGPGRGGPGGRGPDGRGPAGGSGPNAAPPAPGPQGMLDDDPAPEAPPEAAAPGAGLPQ